MRIRLIAVAACLLLGVSLRAQTSPQNSASQLPPNQAPPSSADQDDPNISSSRDTQIDISPPKNDVKDHPNSSVPELTQPANSGNSGDVNELHPYNPYRADKDNEVGEYYLKLKDYKGALARFQDALLYKPNDAMANLRMAECYEKMNDPAQAAVHYREYLRILPNGPDSKKARKALEKLPGENTAAK